MSEPQTVSGIDRVQLLHHLRCSRPGRGPEVVWGTSWCHHRAPLGDAAAAVVAGALSLHDGLRVSVWAPRLMSRIAGKGAMASVECPANKLSELAIRGISDVVLAVASDLNCRRRRHAVDATCGGLAADVLAREVAVDVASHTPQVDPILTSCSRSWPRSIRRRRKPALLRNGSARATVVHRRVLGGKPAVHGAIPRRRYRPRSRTGTGVFGELHPLLTYAVEQNAASLDMPIATLAAMRRGEQLPFAGGFVFEAAHEKRTKTRCA